MRLEILLPFRRFADRSDVLGIVADTSEGALGLLPRRLDCAAALVPGILAFTSTADGTTYVAIDGGVLVKSGTEVLVCTRRAVASRDLAALHEAVKRDFLQLDSQERAVRTAVAKMEGALLGRLLEFQHAR